MKLTPVAKKNNKAKKQGFLSRSKNILKRNAAADTFRK